MLEELGGRDGARLVRVRVRVLGLGLGLELGGAQPLLAELLLVLPPRLVPLDLGLPIAHLPLAQRERRLARGQAHLAPRHLLLALSELGSALL